MSKEEEGVGGKEEGGGGKEGGREEEGGGCEEEGGGREEGLNVCEFRFINLSSLSFFG